MVGMERRGGIVCRHQILFGDCIKGGKGRGWWNFVLRGDCFRGIG